MAFGLFLVGNSQSKQTVSNIDQGPATIWGAGAGAGGVGVWPTFFVPSCAEGRGMSPLVELIRGNESGVYAKKAVKRGGEMVNQFG
ncbi:hypothetical protein PABG_12120 [Paracoccidioides brasiliensis Pb03]|nr:hypothetical protein PABG_12120 [Paracoccidioides brasiliensis Pb03]